mgnify:CR=1 FL=1
MTNYHFPNFNNLCVKQDKSENLYVYQIDDNTFILSKKLEDNYWHASIITRSTYTALDSLSPKMISRILTLAPEYDCLSSMWKTLKDTHNPPRNKFFKPAEPPSFLVHNLDLLLFGSHITVQAYDMIYGYLIVKAYNDIYRIDRSIVANNIIITNTTTNENRTFPVYKDKAVLFRNIDCSCKELKA